MLCVPELAMHFQIPMTMFLRVEWCVSQLFSLLNIPVVYGGINRSRKIYFLLFVIYVLNSNVQICRAVDGCITILNEGQTMSKSSFCEKVDTEFTSIPPHLPFEVVKLTIHFQSIKELNASQLRHMPNLRELNLDTNKISRIEKNTFAVIPLLQRLSLRNNFLQLAEGSFEPSALLDMPSLTLLDLSNNPLVQLPDHFFQPLGSTLQSLFLSGVNSPSFEVLPKSLVGLHKLRTLDLSFSKLEYLPSDLEASLNAMQLSELRLYGNPWDCDCRLRWLKLWSIDQETQIEYKASWSDKVSAIMSTIESDRTGAIGSAKLNDGDVSTDVELMSSQRVITLNSAKLLEYRRSIPESLFEHIEAWYKRFGTDTMSGEPVCTNPVGLRGRPIFGSPSAYSNPVQIAHFICPPEVHVDSTVVHVHSGANLTLMCRFFAYPREKPVTWYRAGKEVRKHWPRIHLSESQGRQFTAVLHLTDVNTRDTGPWSCQLVTSQGTTNATMQVNVIALEARGLLEQLLNWVSTLNTYAVLKYTGIAAACLILLLIVIGLLVFFCFGKRSNNADGQSTAELTGNSRLTSANGYASIGKDSESDLTGSGAGLSSEACTKYLEMNDSRYDSLRNDHRVEYLQAIRVAGTLSPTTQRYVCVESAGGANCDRRKTSREGTKKTRVVDENFISVEPIATISRDISFQYGRCDSTSSQPTATHSSVSTAQSNDASVSNKTMVKSALLPTASRVNENFKGVSPTPSTDKTSRNSVYPDILTVCSILQANHQLVCDDDTEISNFIQRQLTDQTGSLANGNLIRSDYANAVPIGVKLQPANTKIVPTNFEDYVAFRVLPIQTASIVNASTFQPTHVAVESSSGSSSDQQCPLHGYTLLQTLPANHLQTEKELSISNNSTNVILAADDKRQQNVDNAKVNNQFHHFVAVQQRSNEQNPTAEDFNKPLVQSTMCSIIPNAAGLLNLGQSVEKHQIPNTMPLFDKNTKTTQITNTTMSTTVLPYGGDYKSTPKSVATDPEHVVYSMGAHQVLSSNMALERLTDAEIDEQHDDGEDHVGEVENSNKQVGCPVLKIKNDSKVASKLFMASQGTNRSNKFNYTNKSEVNSQDNSTLPSYVPCPLHGNLLASFSTNQDTYQIETCTNEIGQPLCNSTHSLLNGSQENENAIWGVGRNKRLENGTATLGRRQNLEWRETINGMAEHQVENFSNSKFDSSLNQNPQKSNQVHQHRTSGKAGFDSLRTSRSGSSRRGLRVSIKVDDEILSTGRNDYDVGMSCDIDSMTAGTNLLPGDDRCSSAIGSSSTDDSNASSSQTKHKNEGTITEHKSLTKFSGEHAPRQNGASGDCLAKSIAASSNNTNSADGPRRAAKKPEDEGYSTAV